MLRPREAGPFVLFELRNRFILTVNSWTSLSGALYSSVETKSLSFFNSSTRTRRGTSVPALRLPCLPNLVEQRVSKRLRVFLSPLCRNSAHNDFGVAFKLPWWPTL